MRPGLGATMRRTRGLRALATPTVSSATAGSRLDLAGRGGLLVAGVAGQKDPAAVEVAQTALEVRGPAHPRRRLQERPGALEAGEDLQAPDGREHQLQVPLVM